PHDSAFAYADAGKNRGPGSDVGPVLDAHRPAFEVGAGDRQIGRNSAVLRTQYLRPRPEADALADRQIARVEKHMRADPAIVADAACAVMPALYDRLRADEDPGPDAESTGMLECRAGTDLKAGTALQRQRAPD